MSNQDTLQTEPDVVDGERGLPSVNSTKPTTNRILVVLFVIIALGITALVFYLNSDGESFEAAKTDVSGAHVPSMRARTFELPPETLSVEPIEVITYDEIKANKNHEAQVVVEKPRPILNKSASSFMANSSSTIGGSSSGGTEDTATAVSDLLDQLGKAEQESLGESNAKSPLASLLTSTESNGSRASFLGDRNYIMAQGSFIDCTLETKLVSTVPGMTSCVISKNLYSDNGKILLVERGAKASGQYASTVTQGQKRIFVLWERIKTPNGVIINLASPGTDSLGGSGLPGHVDNHFWERFGGALMFSLVDDLAQAAVNSTNNADNSISFGGTAESSGDVATEIIKNTINIKPTLYKNQGERINIFVARDLDFSGVYDVKAVD